MRSAISKLGKQKVKLLVETILDHLITDNNDSNIAKEFGLSKATFSRFAGRSWQQQPGLNNIPDLWRNVAKVVHRDPNFLEAVISLGIKADIDLISNDQDKHK